MNFFIPIPFFNFFSNREKDQEIEELQNAIDKQKRLQVAGRVVKRKSARHIRSVRMRNQGNTKCQ